MLSDDLFLPLFQSRRHYFKARPVILGHPRLISQHGWKEYTIPVLNHINALMAVHVNPFTEHDMPISELDQPPLGRASAQRLSETDLKGGEDLTV